MASFALSLNLRVSRNVTRRRSRKTSKREEKSFTRRRLEMEKIFDADSESVKAVGKFLRLR